MSRHSDPTGALLLGIGAGIWTFFKGFRVFREFKIVADTPCMPIRSLPMGLVQVRGTARSEKLIPSPITHTPCCFYQVKIEHYKSNGRSGSWQHYRTDLDGSKFYLQDQTGKVLIDSYSAEYDLPASPPRVVDGAHPSVAVGDGASDQELLQYIETAGTHEFANKIEHWLENKGPLEDPKKEQSRQTLLQMIRVIPNTAAEGGKIPTELVERIMTTHPLDDPEKEQQRQTFLQHIRETGSLPTQLHVSTASGRYRLRESLILPGEEYHVTGTCVENANARDAHDQNMIVQGHSEKTFLISWKPERQVQQDLRKRAIGLILGGAALTLVCLALLLGHLGLY